jgi:hypothetical protein
MKINIYIFSGERYSMNKTFIIEAKIIVTGKA